MGLAKTYFTKELKTNAYTGFRGTGLYMAPELHELEKHTKESDVWAIGTVIYELCTT